MKPVSVYESPLRQPSAKGYKFAKQPVAHNEKIFSTPFQPFQVASQVTVNLVSVEESLRR